MKEQSVVICSHPNPTERGDMCILQKMPKELGWPIDRMFFKGIKWALHRRWFQSPQGGGDEERALRTESAAAGIAFITEIDRSDRVCNRLSAGVQGKSLGKVDMGWATVVRCEALTRDLTFTGVRFDRLQPILQ